MAFWEDWEEGSWNPLSIIRAVREFLHFLRATLRKFWICNSNHHAVWPETVSINVYAHRMALLLLGVKGLGLLLFTWITVVLLGGFVSALKEDDLWSLTAIILIQSAGAFNLLLTEKLITFKVLPRAIRAGFRRIFNDRDSSFASKATATIIISFLIPVYAILLLPVLVLYLFGFYISTGISLWRLIENNDGNPDGGSNLKTALYVCYSLALAQGVLFCCRLLYDFVWKTQAIEQVKCSYKLSDTEVVSGYLKEMVAGCEKNLAFSNGKNLVAYAVELLKGPKLENDISVVKAVFLVLLGTNHVPRRQVVLKQLLIQSESISHISNRLLRMLHPRSHYGREVRVNAAGILSFLADEICLDHFRGGIQCISSLLDTSDEYPFLPKRYHLQSVKGLAEVSSDQHDWLLQIQQRYAIHIKFELCQHGKPGHFDNMFLSYKQLMLQGLGILGKLADDQDNCRVISNTTYLLSKIIAPLISDRLHREHHPEWCEIAQKSLIVVCKLMAAPGETGEKLRLQVSSNVQAIMGILQSILNCTGDDCKTVQLPIVVEILLDLSVNTSSIMTSGISSRYFIEIVLHIFLQRYNTDELEFFQKMHSSIHWMKKRSYIRNTAGEILAKLSSQSFNAMIILQVSVEDHTLLRDLANILVGAKNNTYKLRAAEILEHLCTYSTKDNMYLNHLKKAMLDVLPEVLRELLGYGSRTTSIETETGSNEGRYSAPGSDLEEDLPLHDNEQKNIYWSSQEDGEQHESRELQEALLSLCAMACDKLISVDRFLEHRFNNSAAEICSEQGKPAMTFTSLVEEARETTLKNKAQHLVVAPVSLFK